MCVYVHVMVTFITIYKHCILCIPLSSFPFIFNLQEHKPIIRIIQDNTSKTLSVRETIAIGFQTVS